ncbi:6-phosphofructokinase 1 [Hathewaya proteolytica DSM 3090]|uniref:Pyrophosphate--fructose 6-phosphate 1-phosphotransferase n=1 Tax=Hathewaya proteolytica DSM 3090 TaxID=1121331 RepID=A0A1M6QN63_9CLOT|nr:6-phosphofructokinase [Hathewaya proteolytica]SHK21513.1 6-phosphofructokinase 1 [Hathewaya proteolytica DSM 3090]
MNCIIAQSGGPTAVINSSFIGALTEAVKCGKYNRVLAGINGIQGILNENIKDVTDLTEEQRQEIKCTPAAVLGSCRYKLKSIEEDSEQYEKLFSIFEKHHIDTFFYIGGNDSMDTVKNLSYYAKEKGLDFRAVGIPKTIDNDLEIMDHTPGFASAAKYINTCIVESYLDNSVYDQKSVLIIETMGREAGWLAASAVAAKVNGKQIVDHIYVPENAFEDVKFLNTVREGLEKKDRLYIVVSEGIRYANGDFVANSNNNASHDKFGHAQLGGVGQKLKAMILSSGVTKRVKALEFNILQRCAGHVSSRVDLEEAFELGAKAVEFACQNMSGILPGIIRNSNTPYTYTIEPIEIQDVANMTKVLPQSWIDKENDFITEDMNVYVESLIDHMDIVSKYTTLL